MLTAKLGAIMAGMSSPSIPELPGWEFMVEEFSPGGYRVRVVDKSGVTGEATGTDPDAMLQELKLWAKRMKEGRGT